MDNIEDNEVRFTMRMESALYEQLKKSAQKNRRSIAKELENIVDIHLNKKDYVLIPEPIAQQLNEYISDWLKKHPVDNNIQL